MHDLDILPSLHPQFPLPELDRAIEALIDFRNALDGDPDAEETGAEDSFQDHVDDGAGCPVSDPGGCEHDGREPCEDDEDDDPAGGNVTDDPHDPDEDGY